jgi:Ribbon-helix-helix protein, copG family
MPLKYVPIRLKPELLEALNGIAKKRGKPCSQIMREGLQFYAERNAIFSQAEYSRIMNDEFVFMALELIIRKDHKDDHQGMLDEAARRASALCG